MSDSKTNPRDDRGPASIEMPRSTAWPFVIAAAIALVALGAATDLAFAVLGAALLAVSLGGWIAQLLPGRGHKHEPLVEPARRAKPIPPRPGTVEQLKPGVVGYRFQLPEKVHPVSAGIRGGIAGGLIMPLPALAWSLFIGKHGLWFPVNLLAGMVVPGMEGYTVEQLEQFIPWAFAVGVVIHVVISIGAGLVYGVILPTLPPFPGGPLVFGGIILPLFWTGLSFGLMGVVNPLLQQHVEWRWFIDSQVFYGVAASIVILRSEKIPIAPRGTGGGHSTSPPPAALGCLAAMALFLGGCSDNLPGKPTPADQFVRPEKITDFATLYGQRCAACHGAEGKVGAGPPLNDPLFLALVTDDELREVISHGRKETLMPAWSDRNGGPLNDSQIAALVSGIRARWTPKDTMEVYPSAPPLVATRSTGTTAVATAAVFESACATCHGSDGSGSDMAGPINNPAFLSLVSDQLLRRYIITGRPDLGMPNFIDGEGRPPDFKALTAAQVDQLVALLATWREPKP